MYSEQLDMNQQARCRLDTPEPVGNEGPGNIYLEPVQAQSSTYESFPSSFFDQFSQTSSSDYTDAEVIAAGRPRALQAILWR